MKRVFWILITPTLAFLILWALGTWLVMPRLENWALQEMQSYSKSSLPVEIKASKLHLRVLRPSLSLEDITITPKPGGDIADILSVARIASVRVHLDFFQLLGGRVNLSAVVVDSPEVRINIDSLLKSEGPAKEIPVDTIFSITEKLPLQKIFLQNVHVMVESKQLGLAVEAQNGGLLLTNMGKNLTAKADVPDVKVHSEFGNFAGSFDTHIYATRQSLRILQLGAHLDQSEFILRGEFTPFKDLAIKPAGVLSLSAKVSLSDVFKEIKQIKPKMKFPTLAGQLDTEVEAHFNGLNDLRGKAEINTQSVVVDKFELGDANIQGEFKNRTISFSEIKVKHPAGDASLTKSQIELDRDFAFKSRVKVDSLDLQKLFASMDLKNIPAGLQAKGELPCSGTLRPLSVTCENATLAASDIWVKSENNSKGNPILNLKSMSAQGNVQVTPQAVAYQANLTLGDSVGSSDGVIDFDKGFKINYKTKKLDFKNVQNLAKLRMSGSASIEGSTEGDSSTATFDMSVNARDFIFEDFDLGNVISNVALRKGHLIFTNLAGAQNKTQYIGDLDVDLAHDHIEGNFSSPTTELVDVAKILDHFYHFPINMQGSGAAKAHVDGPLNFWKLSYKVESAFKNVTLGQETFDQLNFNVDAQNGNLKAQKVQLLKNASIVNVTGGISSDQVMNLAIDGKNWKMEESSIVTKINSSIYGTLNFSSELKDTIKNPRMLIKGAITDTVLEDQEIPNSNFILNISRQSIGGKVSLFGDKVNGNFQYPFEKGTPLIVKMKTDNWSFSSLLALVGGANLAAEYESAMTSNIDLRSDSGDFFRSSGKIHVDKFFLKRAHLSLQNNGPMDVVSENGLISFKNFNLQGPRSQIRFTGNNFTTERLNMGISAKVDLRLLQIFLPFLEDLGGPLNMEASISGKLTKPEIIGTANLDNAFVKLKGFPHTIERLSTNVSFSQSKILINDIRGQMAGGTINGEGSVVINGPKDFQTSIRFHVDNATLNVPDKVSTTGSGDLTFAGRWFPFTLSGVYHVSNGLFAKEFTDDSGGGISGVRQSIYLPKVLRESHFEPVLFDLQIILDKSLPVKNSFFDGSVSGTIQVKGSPTNPLLFGRITADRKSKLIFKDKLFDVQNAVIDFTDPNEINPNVFVTANSRITEYDVTLIAQGPAKNPTIKLSSVPPLTDQDIISLIALGVTSTNLDQTAGQQKAVAEQTGAEIGGAVLAKPINKGLEATGLGLNFSVTSQYDSTRNISIPKITLSRQLSERFKVSGSRQVGDFDNYDVKLEYLLNNNITAVGSYEQKSLYENTTILNSPQETENVFGLDLEFKREFK